MIVGSTKLVVILIIILKQERGFQKEVYHSINNSDSNSSKCIAVLALALIHPKFQLRKEKILKE